MTGEFSLEATAGEYRAAASGASPESAAAAVVAARVAARGRLVRPARAGFPARKNCRRTCRKKSPASRRRSVRWSKRRRTYIPIRRPSPRAVSKSRRTRKIWRRNGWNSSRDRRARPSSIRRRRRCRKKFRQSRPSFTDRQPNRNRSHSRRGTNPNPPPRRGMSRSRLASWDEPEPAEVWDEPEAIPADLPEVPVEPMVAALEAAPDRRIRVVRFGVRKISIRSSS